MRPARTILIMQLSNSRAVSGLQNMLSGRSSFFSLWEISGIIHGYLV